MDGSEDEKEVLLEGILNATADERIWLFDRDGTIQFANATALARVDRKAEEVIGKCFTSFIPSCLHESRLARIREVFDLGQPLQFEDEVGGFYFSHSLGPVRNSNGIITAAACFSRNITPRKRAEEEREQLLREVEEARGRFEAVVANSPVGIAVFRGTCLTYEMVNPAYRLFAPGKDFVGRTFAETFPEVLEPFSSIMKAVMETGEIYHATDVPVSIRRHPDGPLEDAFFNIFFCRLPEDPSGHAGILNMAVEMTEQVLTRQKIVESEQKYRTLFNSMDEGFFLLEVICDNGRAVDAKYLEANAAATRMFGKDFTGMRLSEMTPSYEQYWYDLFTEVNLTGKPIRMQRFAEPIQKWIDFYLFKVGGEESKLIGKTFLDITETRKAEQALRESEERFRVAQELSPDGFTILRPVRDEHGEVVDFMWVYENATIARLNGTDPQAVAGHRLSELLPLHAQTIFHINYKEVAETGESRIFEAPYAGDSFQRQVWFRIAVVPLGSDIAVLSQDITERKHAEDELLNSETRFRTLAMASSDAIYKLSPDWSELRSVGGNGFVPDVVEPVRDWLRMYIPPSDQPQVLEAMDKAASAREPLELVHRVYRADGTVGWTLSRAVPVLNREGEIIEWFGTAKDVTDAKLAEEELEQRVRDRTSALEKEYTERMRALQELREKDRLLIQQSRLAAMGEMVHNIAHQWRQPLNTLGLLLQTLALSHELGQFTEDLLDETVDKGMLIIQHMSRTIDDFRDFFKPDKAKVAFKVAEVVTKAIRLVEDAFKNRHITIEVKILADPAITGYPSEFSQVIMNILNNAKDAFQAHEISDARVVVTICSLQGTAVVSIKDNAGGIPEEIIGRVFEPYFSTKHAHGTGIGLFMSKNIIERNMNGQISVSNAGDGAEFKIEVEESLADSSSVESQNPA